MGSQLSVLLLFSTLLVPKSVSVRVQREKQSHKEAHTDSAQRADLGDKGCGESSILGQRLSRLEWPSTGAFPHLRGPWSPQESF